MLRPLAAAAVLLALVTGCDPEDEQPTPAPTTPPASASPELVSGLADLYAGTDPSEGEVHEADCFATALAGALSLDDLEAAGLVDGSGAVAAAVPVLDEATATAWVDAQASCVPFAEVSSRALAVQSKGKLDRDAYDACFSAAISDDDLHTALVATLTGHFDAPEVTTLSEAQADCARTALPPD